MKEPSASAESSRRFRAIDKAAVGAVLGIAALLILGVSGRWAMRKSAPSGAPASIPSPTVDSPPMQSAGTSESQGAAVPSQFVLIDDMAGGTSAVDGPRFMGYWYTYSDGTGTIDPPEHARSYASTRFLDRKTKEFSGGGQTIWGAGFGVGLTEWSEAKLGTARLTTPFDASDFMGIRFDAVSKKTALPLAVNISDVDTNPLGGVCDPKVTGRGTCNADFGTNVGVSDHWQTFTVPFNQLQLPPWSTLEVARSHGFVKSKLYAIHFEIQPRVIGTALQPFDVFVSNIYFIRSL